MKHPFSNEPLACYAQVAMCREYSPVFWRAIGMTGTPIKQRLWYALNIQNLAIERIERLGGSMAKQKETVKFEFKGFINIPLDEGDKARIQATADDYEVFGDMSTLILTGYKVGLAYDSYSTAVQATLTCHAQDDPNYGYAISSRNPDPRLALISVVYKHFEKCGGVWADTERPAPVNWD